MSDKSNEIITFLLLYLEIPSLVQYLRGAFYTAILPMINHRLTEGPKKKFLLMSPMRWSIGRLFIANYPHVP
jgi:hypothetical protein